MTDPCSHIVRYIEGLLFCQVTLPLYVRLAYTLEYAVLVDTIILHDIKVMPPISLLPFVSLAATVQSALEALLAPNLSTFSEGTGH